MAQQEEKKMEKGIFIFLLVVFIFLFLLISFSLVSAGMKKVWDPCLTMEWDSFDHINPNTGEWEGAYVCVGGYRDVWVPDGGEQNGNGPFIGPRETNWVRLAIGILILYLVLAWAVQQSLPIAY